jgi:hypothetical protein
VCRGLGRRPRQDVEATLSEMHGVRQVVNLLPCNRIHGSKRRRRSASVKASAAPAKSHMRRSTPSSNSRRLTCTDTVRCLGAMGGDTPSFSALIRLVLPTCSSSHHTVANARVCTHHLRPDDHHAAATGSKCASLQHRLHERKHAVRSTCNHFRGGDGQAEPAVACNARFPIGAIELQSSEIAATAHEG